MRTAARGVGSALAKQLVGKDALSNGGPCPRETGMTPCCGDVLGKVAIERHRLSRRVALRHPVELFDVAIAWGKSPDTRAESADRSGG